MRSFPLRRARPVDERGRQIHDHAQAVSFRFLAGTLSLVCLYSAIRDGWNATLGAEDVLTLVMLALILNFGLLVHGRATSLDSDHPPRIERRTVVALGVLAIAFFAPPLIAGVRAADLLVIVPLYAAVVATVVLAVVWLRRRRDEGAE